MTKQQLARKRNWFKLRLLGISGFDTSILTEAEKSRLQLLIHFRNKMLEDFNRNSRELGLNAPIET